MGIVWANGYALLYHLHVDAFSVNTAVMAVDLSRGPDFVYYSFVTITTLGYGDISPATAPARSLSMIESITGVLYVAVLVARLVAGYRSPSRPTP